MIYLGIAIIYISESALATLSIDPAELARQALEGGRGMDWETEMEKDVD